MKYLRKSLFLLTLGWLGVACAMPQQDHASIRDVALTYAQTQTHSMPGKVSIQVASIDPRTALPACNALEAFMPNGAKMIGKTSIGVRCNGKPGWSVFVQVNIKVSADLLVANRPLSQGLVLSADDFTVQSGELGQTGILTAPEQAIGKTLKFAIGAGQVLRLDMLRPDFVIRLGQTVRLYVRASNFMVSSEGQAMNDATAGQAVRIKTATGQMISAFARKDGSAEVRQ
ncbi:MAG: flagella basal body P-ring formation protein FlgA [Gallionellaceae bacterium]|nr:MAG: flagella basal body P-ring formation protein FlgA [Gallionellaceae bacterium]